MMKLFLLEDDPQVQQFVSKALTNEGYCITVSSDLPSAQSQFEQSNFDCLILDRHLPSGDSLQLIEVMIMKGKELPPTLFLTALDSTEDKIAGLEYADDYLVKPFSVDELIARVKALLRRRMANSPTLEGAKITLHRFNRSVIRQNKAIDLNPMEFKLLEYLLLNKNHTVTRKMLLEQVWEYNFEPSTSIVETYISRLRRKLEVDNLSSAIKTVKGSGYTIADF